MDHKKVSTDMRRAIIQTDYEKDDVCCICLESMKNKVVLHLPCGHVFHSNCFKKQLEATSNSIMSKENVSCPMCRHKIFDCLPLCDQIKWKNQNYLHQRMDLLRSRLQNFNLHSMSGDRNNLFIDLDSLFLESDQVVYAFSSLSVEPPAIHFGYTVDGRRNRRYTHITEEEIQMLDSAEMSIFDIDI